MGPPSQEPLIHLNVGGTLFTTTAATLTNPRAGDSLLSHLVTSSLPSRKDKQGHIFIDRDGTRFSIVLNFLRNGTVHVVDGVVPCANGGIALSAMVEEARFYGLEELGRLLRSEVRRLELEECLGQWGDERERLKKVAVGVGVGATDGGAVEQKKGVELGEGGFELELDADF